MKKTVWPASAGGSAAGTAARPRDLSQVAHLQAEFHLRLVNRCAGDVPADLERPG